MPDINELKKIREEKLNRLIEDGVNVTPEKYGTTNTIKETMTLKDGTKNVSSAIRSMARDHSKMNDGIRIKTAGDK